MRNTLLASVSAIALIAGAGMAGAQEKGMGGGQAPSAAPSGQMAPQSDAPKGGAEIKSGTTGQSTEPRGDSKGGAEFKSDSKSGTSGQAPAPRAQDQKSEPKAGATQQRSGDTKSDTKAGSTTDSKSGATTGQGAAGSTASLTTEQRTKISTTIRQSNVRPVTNVNFTVSVGTVIPRTVVLHALPAAVIEVYPAWRPYRFILVGDEIVVIDPATHRIVAVLPA